MPLLEQDRNTLVHSWFLVWFVLFEFYFFALCFVSHCLSFCHFSFVHCIVCLCDFLITLLVSSKLPGFYAFLKYYIHDHLHWRLFMFVMYYSYSLAMIDIKKQLLLFITSNYHLWFLQDCSYLTKLIIIRTNVMFSQYSVRVLIPFHIIYSKVNFITMTH